MYPAPFTDGLGAPSAATLVGNEDVQVILASRAGLPEYLTVQVRVPVSIGLGLFVNPFLVSPCTTTVDVKLTTAEGWVLDQARVKPTRDLVALANPFDDVFSCSTDVNLGLASHRGPVRVLVRDVGSQRLLGQSQLLDFNLLPAGTAVDEHQGALEQVGEALRGTGMLVKWAVIGTVVVGGAYVLGPVLKDWAERMEAV